MQVFMLCTKLADCASVGQKKEEVNEYTLLIGLQHGSSGPVNVEIGKIMKNKISRPTVSCNLEIAPHGEVCGCLLFSRSCLQSKSCRCLRSSSTTLRSSLKSSCAVASSVSCFTTTWQPHVGICYVDWSQWLSQSSAARCWTQQQHGCRYVYVITRWNLAVGLSLISSSSMYQCTLVHCRPMAATQTMSSR